MYRLKIFYLCVGEGVSAVDDRLGVRRIGVADILSHFTEKQGFAEEYLAFKTCEAGGGGG